ncbi:MAG: formimidoylglutamase [Chitinophagales bacterium]|nr:formimidoylglutamase [Chitinophagales bacterium]
MLTDYLQPIPENTYSVAGKPVFFYTGNDEDLNEFQIAILGVKDARGHVENTGCVEGPDAIRKQLYLLHNFFSEKAFIDLGNIIAGENFSDTMIALKEVIKFLYRKKIVTIILGGDMSLTLGQYLGVSNKDEQTEISIFDERIVIKEAEEEDSVHETNYLYKLLTTQPNTLKELKILGYQTYFNHQRDLEILEEMLMDTYRLGVLREDIREVEPLIRDSDILSFNISAIKACDAPGYVAMSPNGFFSDEACQIMRYAGAANKLMTLGIYNYNPDYDDRNITAIGIAQMIWYFLEGLNLRTDDFPNDEDNNFQQFIINIEDHEYELIFIKSKRTDRWWMKIPLLRDNIKSLLYRTVPCSYNDYLTAVNSEIPERWLHEFSKNN